MLSQQFNQILYDYRALLFVIFCLLGQIIGCRLWLRRVKTKTARRLVYAVFLLFNLGWGLTVLTLYRGDHLTDFFWSWVGRPSVSWQVAYTLAILPLGTLASVAVGLVRLPFGRRRKAAGPEGIDAGRRDLLKAAGTVGILGILGASGCGVVRQGLPPRVVRLTLAVPGLPEELAGFLIAQVSDVHLGLWSSQKELDQALRLVAEQKPHLAVLTGDLVDRDPEYARLYYEPLKHLAGLPHGVWGVLGNHDHYAGPARIAELLDGHGLTMLMDRRVNLPGLPLTLIGLDDQGRHHSWMGSGRPARRLEDPDALDFARVSGPEPRPGDFTILLNHRPEGFAQAAREGCRLYLAGHTHGGQYQAPWNDQLNLAAAFYKYTSGLYRAHDAFLNVSRGLAAVGIPFRLWAWPEINLIRLERA